MVVGLLSDTHIIEPNKKFELLLSEALGEADAIIHAGDYVGEAVVDYLEYVEPRRFIGVAGNMDYSSVSARLPLKKTVELAGYKIGIMHGWGAPYDLSERILSVFAPRPDIIVHGHSHRALDIALGGVRIVNPGAAFDGRSGSAGSTALLRLGPDKIDVVFKETPF